MWSTVGYSVGSALLGLALSAAPLLAACYAPNKGAYGFVAPSPPGRGIEGRTDLAAAAPTAGNGIAHPIQITSSSSMDWLGWGTYRGYGPPGCGDNNGSSWELYVDGVVFGAYFCQRGFGYVANGSQNQTFRLSYTWCPLYSINRWTAVWNGVTKACVALNGTRTDGVAAGGEAAPSTAPKQNITVRYELMKYQKGDGTWVGWPVLGTCKDDPPYWIDSNSNTDYWVRVR